MNLQLVMPTSVSFLCSCNRCEKRMWVDKHNGNKVYADLDGESFKAYYCEECADILKWEDITS